MVVLNRNGADLLRCLLAGLVERTDYPCLELIVVDNASADDSVDFLRAMQTSFPIRIIANAHNESFSDGCNQGAEIATGELLLFVNNDVEPLEPGWLRELVACLTGAEAGVATATLMPPIDAEASTLPPVQTQRLRLRAEGSGLVLDDPSGRRDLFGEGFGRDVELPLGVAACMLVRSDLFHVVGGFPRGYFYGFEDFDLSIAVRAAGMSVIWSGRSVLVHRTSVTLRKLTGGGDGFDTSGNVRLLFERWGPRVWREYELDRLSNRDLWAAPHPDTPANASSREEAWMLSFCLKADRDLAEADEARAALGALSEELARRGHRHRILLGESERDLSGFLYDVAVHLRGASRALLAPSQLNVLWDAGPACSPSVLESTGYDLAISVDRDRAGELVDAVLERAHRLGLPRRVEG